MTNDRAGNGEATADGHTHEVRCLNCDAPLVGPHCHQCGQRAHVHRTLSAFGHDLLHGVLHFEGKTWHTLPLLAWRPGRLTREYIAGRRARYIGPVALFLFVVFVSFALFNAFGGVGTTQLPSASPATRSELEVSVEELDEAIVENEQALAEARASGAGSTRIDRIEAKLAEDRSARALAAELLETMGGKPAPTRITTEIDTGSSGADFLEWVKASWIKAKQNPGLLIYKLQSNAYKLSWLLIPLSVPFLWLLFPFSRRFGLYDHTVFVTYSISFMTILVVIASLAGANGLVPVAGAALAYAPFHLYRQLREAYELTRFGALWRLVVLSVVIWLVIALFALIMVGMVLGE